MKTVILQVEDEWLAKAGQIARNQLKKDRPEYGRRPRDGVLVIVNQMGDSINFLIWGDNNKITVKQVS